MAFCLVRHSYAVCESASLLRSSSSRTRHPTSSDLKIVVDKKAAIVVGFKPVAQMNLAQIRGDDFLAELVRFRAQERTRQSCDARDHSLPNACGVTRARTISRHHLPGRG